MPLGLDQAERGGELVHPEVEPVDLVVGLAVVAELAGELDQLGVRGDEHPALAGRDRLGRVERVDARVAEAARLATVPARRRGRGRSPRAGRSRSRGSRRRSVGVEGEVAADVDEDRRPRLQSLGLGLEVLEGHAEVVAIAVDELDLGAGLDRGQRRRHEGVGGAEHGLAPHAGELERRQGAARPTAQSETGQAVPLRPALARRRRASAPSDHCSESSTSFPQLEEARTVAVVEPDRELGRVRPGCLVQALRWLLRWCVAGKVACRRERDQVDARRRRRKASSASGGERLRKSSTDEIASAWVGWISSAWALRSPRRPRASRRGAWSRRRRRHEGDQRDAAARACRPTTRRRSAAPATTGTSTWTANITGATRVAGRGAAARSSR